MTYLKNKVAGNNSFFVNVDELKKFYFNNLGEELISTLNERGKNLGLNYAKCLFEFRYFSFLV